MFEEHKFKNNFFAYSFPIPVSNTLINVVIILSARQNAMYIMYIIYNVTNYKSKSTKNWICFL